MLLLIQTHNVTNVAVLGKDYKSERVVQKVRAVRVRALSDDPHLHAYRYIIPFFKGNLSYFEKRFSLSEAIDKYKRKTEVINP
jgi:hypothetical protein